MIPGAFKVGRMVRDCHSPRVYSESLLLGRYHFSWEGIINKYNVLLPHICKPRCDFLSLLLNNYEENIFEYAITRISSELTLPFKNKKH